MLSIAEAVDYDKVVITTVKDKVYVGKLVKVEDDLYAVRTGKQGRPPILTADTIKKIEVAA